MMHHFWQEIKRPLIGLSPMDGVTDPAFRRITALHGKPDLIITEFASADGICHGAETELSGLRFDEIERPVVAQIYGADPALFFKAAQLVCELGFDGLDINMGCPAKRVSSKGCGAGLITDPTRAQAIIRSAKEGIKQWADGAPLSALDLHPKTVAWAAEQKKKPSRRIIPVSVKTRLGTNRIVIKEWVQHLLDANPAAISIHGRTLSQGYRGSANWDAIYEAALIARGSGTLIFGNGDIATMEEAHQKIRQGGVDGVLIGRSSLGNPWIFQNLHPLYDERIRVALEHATIFQEINGSYFSGMRKHLGWYCRGFQGASKLRAQLVRVKDLEETKELLLPYLSAVASL